MAEGNPTRKENILAETVGDETLLYSADAQAVHTLNATALTVWQCCDGEHSPTQIAAVLRAEFSIPEGRDVLADVEQVLAVFRQKGLLK